MSVPEKWHQPATGWSYLQSFLVQLLFVATSVAVGLSIGTPGTVQRFVWGLLTFYYLNLYRRAAIVGYWARKTAIYLKNNYPTHVTTDSGAERSSFVIFLAAYRAPEVILVTLHKLLIQQYPKACYRIFVITERTESAGRGQVTTGEAVERFMQDTKPPNLTHLTSFRRSCKADALNLAYTHCLESNIVNDDTFVLVLDSDSFLPPYALQVIDEEIRQDGNRDIIRQLASIPMANYASGDIFTKFISMADSVGAVGRWSSEVRTSRRPTLHAGSGVVIPLKLCHYLTSRYGEPWDARVITEDARLLIGRYSLLDGARMKTKAVPCPLIEAVPFGNNLLETYRSFWNQRVRWATGGYDEFLSLATAKPDQIFVTSSSYMPYSPTVGEAIAAMVRRLRLTVSWTLDHAWWGTSTLLSPLFWMVGTYVATPPRWVSMAGLAAVFIALGYLLGVCFTEFQAFTGRKSGPGEFFLLSLLSFPLAFFYTLPVLVTQLTCLLGGRKRYQGWNPATIKPGWEQISSS